MIHGSTSFNFCWSTNVEHCCDLLKRCCNFLNTHSTFVEQQQHFGAKLKWRTRKCCCHFALRALSPLSWSGDKKDAKTVIKTPFELELSWFQLFGAMLILPRNHMTPNSKNDWFKPFNSRQLVEWNRTKFYFRSTTFNNFQHVARQISTFNITWYTVNICWTAATTSVAQQMLNRVSLALSVHLEE